MLFIAPILTVEAGPSLAVLTNDTVPLEDGFTQQISTPNKYLHKYLTKVSATILFYKNHIIYIY